MTILNSSTVENQNVNNGKILSSSSSSAKKRTYSIKDDIIGHISTVFHTLVCAFAVYMLWLCCKDNQTWTLLTWHVFLFTFGWALFMTEGLLILTKENIYSKRISHLLRVRFHWIIESLALICALSGFLCVFFHKEQNDVLHFQSNHSIYGLVSVIFCLPTCVTGLLALFNIELKRYVKPAILKLLHAVCGIVTLLFGGATMILCLYTRWFSFMSQDSNFAFYVAYVILVGGFLWCILRPTINSFQRIKGLVSK